jgi:hypothetical protein
LGKWSIFLGICPNLRLDRSTGRRSDVETKTWAMVTEALAGLEATVLDDPRITDDRTRAEGLRYLTRIIAGGIPLTMEGWDHLNPRLIQFLTPMIQFGLPAADCRYDTAAVHGDHVYRITGTRGTSRMFDVETRTGHMARLAGWKLVDRCSEFDVNSDGTIEVVLSREEQPGNWIRLAEGPGSIVMRQYYYDWLTEQPADLRIERDGAQYPAPPFSPEQVQEGLELLRDWLRIVPAACRHAVGTHYDAPADSVAFGLLDFGWADLQYGKGYYRCGPDEAVLLELTPPQAPYWGVQLGSHFWEARDWQLRQSSLNGHQVVLDEDGVFRAVISHRDPGVANWLDAGGHESGLIAIRLYKADSTPAPVLRTVPFDALGAELPASTTRVYPEQRAVSVRERALSVYRRRCD